MRQLKYFSFEIGTKVHVLLFKKYPQNHEVYDLVQNITPQTCITRLEL